MKSLTKTGISRPSTTGLRLLILPLPLGSRITGRCTQAGGSQPKASYSSTCSGADGSHSSPRSTWVISIRWSSTTTAR